MQHVWAIVLAGGAGRRVADITGGVPKQFWRAHGTASFLERTLARLRAVAERDRTVVVVDESHRRYLRRHPDFGGSVLYQPADRGTAAGVLFGLLPVAQRDSGATVILSPADQDVRNETLFHAGTLDAVARVQRGPRGIVLLGVQPTRPDQSYGWIVPGRAIAGGPFREVDRFVEKPERDDAAALYATGAAWNTMVLVARATSLLGVFRRQLPGLTARVSNAWLAAGRGDRDALADAYSDVGCFDFSRDVLASAAGLAVSIWPAAMGWSDLGTPAPLGRWLHMLGRADRQDSPGFAVASTAQ